MTFRFARLCLYLTAAVPLVLPKSAGAGAAEPTVSECLTASDASLASANDHKLRAERAALLVCAKASCPADIRKECLRRVDEVNVAIPTVIFEVKDMAHRDLSAVRVSMDGEMLAERLDGMELAVDPGDHRFTFEMTGYRAVQQQLVIRQGEKNRREHVVVGNVDPASPMPASAALGPDLHATKGPQNAPSDGRSGLGTQKTLALVAAGVGVVGIGLGTAFGVVAMSKKEDAERICPASCADAEGSAEWASAKQAGNISTTAFIIGGAGLVAGATLWLTAKPESNSGPARMGVRIGPGAVELKGTW